jgi:AraC family transcriptional regulator of adaptative response/methylated-DNA-[protein]-cysteine methyltransferase
VRARSAEENFFYGVKTTGIFCRPNCRSRRPKRWNVEFFESSAEAVSAGYRPCKRCQPEGRGVEAELEERLARARRLLEGPEGMGLRAVAKAVGMSAFHFHRLFKARVGLTPKQYQMAHRLERFKRGLRRGGEVTRALYEAGYNSASRAYEQLGRGVGMGPGEYQRGAAGLEVAYGLTRTGLGWVLVAATGRGVCAVDIDDRAEALRERLEESFPRARLREDRGAVREYLAKVEGYLASPREGLLLPLDAGGSGFQRQVWEALQRVPAGETVSYGELARRVGRPGSVRAVARACASNRVALGIPCHRAVRSDGGLAGYRWGVERKQALLEAEAKR